MPIAKSLRARVVIWVSVALTVLFALTIAGLDATFARSTDRSLRELLEVQLLGLIALAEPDATGGLSLPADAVEPQFEVANSGLYGVLLDGAGRRVWQSSSLIARELRLGAAPAPGERRFLMLEPEGLPAIEALVMGITWEFADGRVAPYTFAIAVSLEPYRARREAFRLNLVVWFAGITVTMLIVVAGVLSWVLRPLRRLERQVREVEDGERAALSGHYPRELVGLAGNLNALIGTERRRLARHRNMLDDLAHSLKTPLAVVRSLLSELAGGAADAGRDQTPLAELNRELDRMDQLVSYRLRRARASGATGLGVDPVPVGPAIDDLRAGLDKVYRDKRIECELRVGDGAVFQGDPGDLTEILGNLLDNAYKYCRGRVRVAASSAGGRLSVTIEDDGPGVGASEVHRLLERGGRADESVPGQGIGLAVVREIVALYRGRLRIERSELGGAAVRVELARAGAPTGSDP